MSAATRALAFAALAAYVSLRWVSLVSSPPVGRTLVVVAMATAAGLAVAATGRALSGWRSLAARIALLAGVAAAGAVTIGLSPHLLEPGARHQVADGIGRGLIAIQITDWPYHGGEPWVRLSILLVIPAMVTVAAGLGFWSERRGGAPRIAAAAVLVTAFAIAAIQEPPAAPLLVGVVLSGLLAVWLFGPALVRGRAVSALAAVAVAAAAAVPVAAILPASVPIVNYQALAFGTGIRFNWDQTYGPINWPRDERVVMQVDSVEPHYWKALTLDEFDGHRWVHSAADTGRHPLAEVPNFAGSRWQTTATVTVGALESGNVVAPGPILATSGISNGTVGDDGTEWVGSDLRAGDTYTVRSYAPDPTAKAMRAAPPTLDPGIHRYMRLELPRPSPHLTASSLTPNTTTISVPPYGRAGGERGRSLILQSPYRHMYRLSHRLAAPASNSYGVVRRVEQYLRTNYTYSESPPVRRFPLAAFLFRDRIGYCQQFSGAMALMLRMAGIPARVAAGFAPGEGSGTTWTVTDSDAHAWVEVYFAGIGWVPFDPTPPGGPAQSVTSGVAVSAARGNEGRVAAPLPGLGDLGKVGAFLNHPAPAPAISDSPQLHKGAVDQPSGGSSAAEGNRAPLGLIGAVLAALGVTALALAARGSARRSAERGEIGEVQAALAAVGMPLPPGETLADLERSMRARGRALAARHLALLAARRYGPVPAPALDPSARRAFRSAIAAGHGPLAHLRAYAALYPRRH